MWGILYVDDEGKNRTLIMYEMYIEKKTTLSKNYAYRCFTLESHRFFFSWASYMKNVWHSYNSSRKKVEAVDV